MILYLKETRLLKTLVITFTEQMQNNVFLSNFGERTEDQRF